MLKKPAQTVAGKSALREKKYQWPGGRDAIIEDRMRRPEVNVLCLRFRFRFRFPWRTTGPAPVGRRGGGVGQTMPEISVVGYVNLALQMSVRPPASLVFCRRWEAQCGCRKSDVAAAASVWGKSGDKTNNNSCQVSVWKTGWNCQCGGGITSGKTALVVVAVAVGSDGSEVATE